VLPHRSMLRSTDSAEAAGPPPTGVSGSVSEWGAMNQGPLQTNAATPPHKALAEGLPQANRRLPDAKPQTVVTPRHPVSGSFTAYPVYMTKGYSRVVGSRCLLELSGRSVPGVLREPRRTYCIQYRQTHTHDPFYLSRPDTAAAEASPKDRISQLPKKTPHP
jgi:hypothetical protein